MTAAEIANLLSSLRAGTLTPAARQQLEAVVRDGSAETPFKEDILQELESDSQTHVNWTPEKEELILVAILSTINTAPASKLIPLKRFWWLVASIVVLLGLGGYFYFLQPTTKIPQDRAARFQNDIAPGGNRAILMLANGSQIILDNAHKGVLAKQGNVDVTKTDSGRLAYNASIEKPNNHSTPSEILYNTLTTPRGGQYQLSLPDGTKVWLNAASSIVYPTAFVGNERKVTITGEVYFEVVHNPAKPFIVSVNDMKVEVLGTHFNVNAYPDESSINTTLIEGSIKINKTITLKPGQQSQFVGSNIRVINNANLDEVMAWKNGRLNMTNCSVQQVMNQISRWYDVDIKYAGTIPNKNFFAVIDRNVPLSVVLEALQAYGVNTTLEGKTLIVR